MTYFLIYKTTNIVNGKFYIGQHRTDDWNDDYLGSGKLLKRAMSKYGIDNFHREILHICESEKQMNTLEKILIVPDEELNYNLCLGGMGGQNKGIPRTNEEKSQMRGKKRTEEQKQRMRKPKSPEHRAKLRHDAWNKGKTLSDTHKENVKKSLQNMCWITDGLKDKKIKQEELDFWLNLGYTKGRVNGRGRSV